MSNTVTNFSSQINVNFPVAGEDNDSQGFRSNFSKIQNALSSAGQQLDGLQVSSVSLNDQNDFGDNIIKRASFQSCSEVVKDRLTEYSTTATFTVNYEEGTYQRFIVNYGLNTFTVDNWPPSGKLGSISLEITPAFSTATNVYFNNVDYISTSSASLPASYTQALVPVIWKLWTWDEGTTVFAEETNFKSNV